MDPGEIQRAVAAARATASSLQLRVEDAVVVHNSNRIVVRLRPCNVLARIAALAPQIDNALEVEVARRLAETGSPVAGPDHRAEPRVYAHDGFAITFWTYFEPVAPAEIAPWEYARALAQLHAGLRTIEISAPHFTDRVAEAQQLVADPEQTPELARADRELLGDALSRLRSTVSARGVREQLLHGEPHLGNLLRTSKGLLFIDFETCCRGPVEFDIAHGLLPSEDGRMLAADEVCARYPAADPELVDQCRTLIWAMITTWRWQRGDELPNGRHWAIEGLNQLRAALGR